MENASDALIMAAAVLIFVLALSLSINSFGQARTTAQVLLDYNDREYDYTYVEEAGSTRRIVGVETIIPSMYRAYKENYKIVFEGNPFGDEGIYGKENDEGLDDAINYIDLEKEVLGSDAHKEEFLKAIIYGQNGQFANWLETKKKYKTNYQIKLKDIGIYDTIKANRFQEELGVYYQEEVNDTSDTPDANKTKKRVITYTKI